MIVGVVSRSQNLYGRELNS